MFTLHQTVKTIDVKPLKGNDVAPPLGEINKLFTIKQMHFCSCGMEHLDVGLKSIHNRITCWHCKEVLPNSSSGGIHWCHPSRFIAA